LLGQRACDEAYGIEALQFMAREINGADKLWSVGNMSGTRYSNFARFLKATGRGKLRANHRTGCACVD
jgi:hypothetical protein